MATSTSLNTVFLQILTLIQTKYVCHSVY
jgi:hypothetical protein